MTQRRSSALPSLTFLAAAWGGVAAATFAARAFRRRRNRLRETRVAARGGLLPQARNAVRALEWRATSEESGARRDALALAGADGAAYTWSEYYEEVRRFAGALVASAPAAPGGAAQQQQQQHGVAVHAFNEPRWFVAAVGALAAGWTVSGIYLTNTYEQASHILRTSGVRVLVLESEKLLETTYSTVLKDFPELKVVLLNGGDDDIHSRRVAFRTFVESGAAAVKDLKAPADLADDAVASLVYTSGTTGNPKAVELTHGCIASVCAMMHARIPLDDKTVVVSYLPLSHIAAMGIDIYSSLFCGAEVHFADSNALRGSLKDTLLRVRPTLFFGVPRVWEKMAAAMQAAAAESYAKKGSGRILQAIGSAAKAVGGAWWSADTPELVRCLLLAVPFGAFKLLVYHRVRRGCGLDRCGLLCTGAAPLPAETAAYLRSLDMPLLEGFGMSESAGAITQCGPTDGARPQGACGRPLPNGTLEIARDGEVLWRGRNNMRGYRGLPEESEAALSSRTGLLRTGDLGRVDDLGYLYITGRKKDLIITAGGENVAPTPIEETLKSLLGDAAGHVVLVGDRRKFLTILVAPAGIGTAPSPEDVEAAMNEYNLNYAQSRAQRVQKAHVLEVPFGVETAELTPTMKLKRAFVIEKFAADIDAMYTGASSALVAYTSMNIGKIDPAIA